MITIEKIALPLDQLEDLRREAKREGYGFVETLFDQWMTGENRFAKQGELLLGCYHQASREQAQLIAVGGLTIDPFLQSPEIGRIRRVYVRPAWRNQGVGTQLVKALIAASATTFSVVRLRAQNADAARLYESLGFTPIADENATHALTLRAAAADPRFTAD